MEPSSTTNPVDRARELLVSELRQRGVSAAVEVASSVEDVDKAMQTVAYFDSQPNAGAGALVKALREGWEPPPARAAASSKSRSRPRWEDWARRERFPEYLVPWAASVGCTMRSMRVEGVTKETVLAHLRRSQPQLFEDAREPGP